MQVILASRGNKVGLDGALMGNRRLREREERQNYILEKAQELFARKGYLGTSMAEIAEASEFAVGSLYTFFNSKEKILATIFEKHIEQILGQTRDILTDSSLTAREKIEKGIDALVRLYVDNQDFYKIYVYEARETEWGVRTEVGHYIYEGTAKYLEIFSEIFRQAMEEGVVDKDLDPEFLAHILRNYLHSTVSHLIYSDRSLTVDEMISVTKRMLFHGISPSGDSVTR